MAAVMPETLSTEVLKFLQENIESVPHLEALLLLWQNVPTEWNAVDVAARIYVPLALSLSILDDLTRRRLTIRTGGEPLRYSFNREGAAAAIVPEVAAAYRHQLIAVSTFIHAKGPASVLAFARAFQIKGDHRT